MNYFDSPEKLKELVGMQVDKATRVLKKSGWFSDTYKGSDSPIYNYVAPKDGMELDGWVQLYIVPDANIVKRVYGFFSRKDRVEFDYGDNKTESRRKAGLKITVHERNKQ